MSAVLDLEVKKAYTKSESFHLVCHVIIFIRHQIIAYCMHLMIFHDCGQWTTIIIIYNVIKLYTNIFMW